MANHKRRKPRTKVRCTMCTPYRWGNMKKRFAASSLRKMQDKF